VLDRTRIHHAAAPIKPGYFGTFVLFLLAGYALFGRGFAYIGIPPIFIGEIGLALAVATLLYRFDLTLLQSPITWLLAAFMLWSAVCTLPYIETYGIDALRDGVIWGYAIYSLAVAVVLLRFGSIEKVVELYGRAVPIFLLVAPILVVINISAADLIPKWPWGPGAGVGIINLKPGDLAVHYSGIFAFSVLGLSATLFRLRWMIVWFIGVAPSVLLNRGGLVAVSSVMMLVLLLRPTPRYFYHIVVIGIALVAFYIAGLEFHIYPSGGRTISVEQLIANIQSIVSPGDTALAALEGTRMWRQMWWDTIVNYTFFGDHFWTGKGFGINLADADGFQVGYDRSLRSPHNVHMTILARAGVPGIALWFALQMVFGVRLMLNFLADKRSGRMWLASVELWVLSYWLAFLINGSFDVFLEGSQGGIWFWSLFGFGLALILNRQQLIRFGG
jgi:hypothetical protein